ncbi:MAG: hypothetical protein HY423_02225 [Candidatus Lambdaproteobacteria bacterium]|nr:hypothetical protein [Candidatus Lambdaproteobacteria bacterium]
MSRARGGVVAAALVLAAAVWSLGLGDSGSGAKTIPIPEKNYTATVTDLKGNIIEAERFSWDGHVYFKAQYGNATITLPFTKVKSLKVLADAKTALPEQVLARVTLQVGETIDVAMDRTSKAYGDTRYGSYEIFLKDLSEITFK